MLSDSHSVCIRRPSSGHHSHPACTWVTAQHPSQVCQQTAQICSPAVRQHRWTAAAAVSRLDTQTADIDEFITRRFIIVTQSDRIRQRPVTVTAFPDLGLAAFPVATGTMPLPVAIETPPPRDEPDRPSPGSHGWRTWVTRLPPRLSRGHRAGCRCRRVPDFSAGPPQWFFLLLLRHLSRHVTPSRYAGTTDRDTA